MKMTIYELQNLLSEVEIVPDKKIDMKILWKETETYNAESKAPYAYSYTCPNCGKSFRTSYKIQWNKGTYGLNTLNTYCSCCGNKNLITKEDYVSNADKKIFSVNDIAAMIINLGCGNEYTTQVSLGTVLDEMEEQVRIGAKKRGYDVDEISYDGSDLRM